MIIVGYVMVIVYLISMVIAIISAKIQTGITFKEIINGFKRRWESHLWALSSFFIYK